MKAIVATSCGPPEVLKLREVAKPAPSAGQVLIKLYASSVNPLDSFVIKGPLFFLPALGRRLKPKHPVLGADYAGRVESVGTEVKQFHPGDKVFGAWFEGQGLGGFAEYVCAPEDRLALMPTNLSFEQAAAVPIAALTALQGLRDYGQIAPGQSVLIDGSSGGVGTFAVQIARSFGAEVTAVCSPGAAATARSIGADHAIDYTRENFTQGSKRYDLIFGANAHHSIFDYRRALKPNGVFVMVGGSLPRIFQAIALGPLLSRIGDKRMRFFVAKISTKDLNDLKDLLERGQISPVIDRTYLLSDTAEAMVYREQGHAKGKVVISICPED